MSTQRKYLFDIEFAADRPERDQLAERAAEEAQQVKDAAFEAGRASARAEIEAEAAYALAELGLKMQSVAAGFCGYRDQMDQAAIDIGLAIARQLIDLRLIADEELQVRASLARLLNDIAPRERVVVRVRPPLCEALAPEIAHLAECHDLTLMLQPDASMGPADVQIDWRAGAVRIDHADAIARVAEALQAAFTPAPTRMEP
jgi:flagellar biosynthesis/type III secretory pathway protein FliH